ncbi:MAG TPA: efflux RND transporter periplasmic adaptor subunit [Planctomycetaceae bacterium]|nr:efflux RND transporter periplasmic adaptor subunit [Planctomycetaceae bacterium]
MKLPRVRDGLTIQAISPTEYVVKRRDNREYFSIGPQEACLLALFNGSHSVQEIQAAYADRFQDQLSESDLQEFIAAVRPMGLFQPASSTETSKNSGPGKSGAGQSDSSQALSDGTEPEKVKSGLRSALRGQSILFFRLPLSDPDVFLGRLVKTIPFVWTRGFLIVAACVMLAALSVMISSSAQLANGIPNSAGWGHWILFIVVMLVCTWLHEIGHGATLKHFGGEVHDSGLLFMFFTPCMYCNVSDAWLIPDKWKRLTVTAAGGICDLCVWALAVFVWRVTVIGTAVNGVAFMALTICGGRSLLNFNPLLRLDGYYLLSDWLSIPNLRPRAKDHWMSHLRWLLWGAARPPSQPRSLPLLLYGFMCWCFALVFLDLIFIRFFSYMGGQFGVTGLTFVLLLMMFGLRRVFKGFFSSEFGAMLKTRPGRTLTWIVGLLCATTLLFLVPVRSTTSGDFEVRPGSVVQLHVPVGGIVQRVLVEDGAIIEEGQLVAELKSPTLASEILKAEDQLREVEASLQRLTAGARPEELRAAQDRVQRLTEWYDQGVEELRQSTVAYDEGLLVQQHRIREFKAELENTRQNLAHSERLYKQGALAGAQLRQDRLQLVQMESRLAQAEAATNVIRALGIQTKESEIARRTQELEEARDRLKLLQAGSRPEDIAAEEARRERVSHELTYLKAQNEKLRLRATTSGIFSAPRLKERIGQVAFQDSLFGTIEKPETSRVEISVSEDEAAHLKPGQPVSLKVRAIPFETFEATVEGISATALKAVTTSDKIVVVHCQIRNPDGRLKSGMTGSGRITRGWNSIGMIMIGRGVRYIRTEFWW